MLIGMTVEEIIIKVLETKYKGTPSQIRLARFRYIRSLRVPDPAVTAVVAATIALLEEGALPVGVLANGNTWLEACNYFNVVD